MGYLDLREQERMTRRRFGHWQKEGPDLKEGIRARRNVDYNLV
jgi:hypothetical protein